MFSSASNQYNTTMPFTLSQQKMALFVLCSLHLLIIAASNYLVQIPFEIAGFHSTWGTFSFPFIFVATDLTVRIFGAPLARRIIFLTMFPALFVSYLISVLFVGQQWAGWQALNTFNLFVARIAIASFLAYSIGQIMDILVFNRLRQRPQWWLAPACAMIIGNIVDTLVFFSVAFYRTDDAYLAEHWVEIAFIDYLFKITACLIFFLPLYGVLLNYLLRKLSFLGTKISQTTLA